MDITISLDGVLTEEQRREITRMLADADGDPVAAFCRAAVAESADAILMRRQDSAANTPLQRLYRLIKHAFNGKIPNEAAVGRIFGVTERRAASMILTVAKRYSSDFEQGWIGAVKAAFDAKEAAMDEHGNFYKFNAPQPVVDYIKEVIARLSAGRLSPIRRVKDTAELFEIRKDTYDEVCRSLGLPPS